MHVLPRRRTESTSRSRASTSGDSEGSVEGQYNFAAEDDEIDEGMFAGDRNSHSSFQDPTLRYLDPARLNHDIPPSSEYSVDDVIRLENFKPRASPIPSRKNSTTVYADVDVINDSKRTEDGDLDSGPPSWAPPPPPVTKNEPLVYSQVEDNRRTSPDKLTGGFGETTKNGPTSSDDSSEDEDNGHRLTVEQMEPPQYSQVDLSKKKNRRNAQDNSEKDSAESAKNEPVSHGSSFYSGDTSEDDDTMDWPPPPPPPQRLSYQPDDSDWERPLPPDILALPGKRDRVASWARDEAEDATDFDDFTKI